MFRLPPAALRSAPAAAAAATLALALLTAEAAARRADWLGASFDDEASRYLADTEPDPLLGYRHRPGTRARYQGVEVAINSRGLREREATPGLGKRILLLGGSVAFGWGVEAEQTWGRRLEEFLPEVETINAGVGGYGTPQQLRYLREEGFALAPDAVFLLYAEDAARPPMRRGRSDGLRGLVEASRLGRLGFRAAARISKPSPMSAARKRRESLEALVRIGDLCRRKGIPFAVFFYRLECSPASDRVWNDLVAAALRRGFSAVDSAPWFAGRDPRDLTNSFVDRHPNAEAHGLLAAGIAETLLPRETATLR